MDRIKKYIEELFGKKDSSGRLKIIVAAGLAAVVLLALPISCGDKEPNTAQASEEITAEQYADILEKRLEYMIESIDGAGDAKVMVTLRNGIEYIYASEDKSSVNTAESVTNSGGQSSEAKENSENNCIIIKTDSGEKALVRTAIMPAVSGVAVICEGADNPEVQERIVTLVTTALSISSRRVCVIKSQSN